MPASTDHRDARPSLPVVLLLLGAYVVGMGLQLLFFHSEEDASREVYVYAALLLLAPVGLGIRRRRRTPTRSVSEPTQPSIPRSRFGLAWLAARPEDASTTSSRLGMCAATAIVAATSIAASVGVARMSVGASVPFRFGELPPAYHDEYSYLFQARTFLAGRLSYASHPTAARLFDQMHVLNEGRFTGRYFPATGAWLAPFVALGQPYWGHWLAGALTAVFIFWTGRELASNGVGLLAGLLTALSPGMALFSNLLLAHHPTLLGLSLFLFAFARFERTRTHRDAVLAGIGLTGAMFARPMTAFGVGLPFGVWTVCWLIAGNRANAEQNFAFRLKRTASLGAPLLLGFALLFLYNRALTGSGWTTPYQVYTDTYTPRHVYGFHNAQRGEERLEWGEKHRRPESVRAYDEWAEDLTPDMAARNVVKRLLASWYWSLGVVPLGVTLVMATAFFRRFDRRWMLVAAAIVTLHAVHVPYWYDGIMHWHYVFESGPLWLLLFAKVTELLLERFRSWSLPLMPAWWCGVTSAAIVASYVPCPALWPSPHVRAAVETAAFSRVKYALFRAELDAYVTKRPALVLVDYSDPHIDYVVNDPALESEVLFGRYLPHDFPPDRLASLFPERAVYLARLRAAPDRWEFQRVPRESDGG